MPEITKEEAKKELQDIVKQAKTDVMTEEQKKAQEDALKQEEQEEAKATAQKAKDDAILAKKEEERTAEEKERAKTLAEEQVKAEEKNKAEEEAKLSADDKIKRIQEKTQKRIDEVSRELKEMQGKSSKEADELRKELNALRVENEQLRQHHPEDVRSLLARQEKERIAKYLEEDRDKPREERREMSKEELDDWYIQDQVSATDWMLERKLRHERDTTADKQRIAASDLIGKQRESLKRTLARHPDISVEQRVKELTAQGKSGQEVLDIILKENAKYRILWQISQEHPEYLSAEDGPEKAVTEMEKRLAKSSNSSAEKTDEQKKIDELTAQVEELSAEIANIRNSDEGINSTISRPKIKKDELSAQEQSLVDTMKSAGAGEESIQKALKKFRVSKGIK